MKKIIAFILAAACVLSLVACSSETDNQQTTKAAETGETVSTTAQPVSDSNIKKLASQITDIPEVDELNLSEPAAIDIKNKSVMQEYFGSSLEGKVDCAVIVEPQIGTVPFSLYVLQASSGQNRETLTKEIFDGTDSKRWHFFSAEKILASYCEDVIIVVMASADMADSVYNAFAAATEQKASEPLTKAGSPVEK